MSNGELDVLMLLEERLSNKEIVLFVSPDTVKKHTINIYRKLNVSGRRQAVTAARKHGFLPVKQPLPIIPMSNLERLFLFFPTALMLVTKIFI
ncbi:MAG: response regulator transcription factor [Desulfobacterales bacterium]|nr:MAG: response regulator transcription factor [Desulfobacterales bacterium]